jgi:hypothetical protein
MPRKRTGWLKALKIELNNKLLDNGTLGNASNLESTEPWVLIMETNKIQLRLEDKLRINNT